MHGRRIDLLGKIAKILGWTPVEYSSGICLGSTNISSSSNRLLILATPFKWGAKSIPKRYFLYRAEDRMEALSVTQ